MMAIAQDGNGMATIARPLERLQARKSNGEQKEAMNCKSCRKRKVRDGPGRWMMLCQSPLPPRPCLSPTNFMSIDQV
jgi:hypothetical protein